MGDLEKRLAEALKREAEALEQQTATSEILRVISSSPTDVQPVFDMIAESAARLCEAQYCFVYRFEGELLHFVAHHGLTAEVLEINRRAYPAPPSRGTVAARAVLEGSVVQTPDVNADPDYALGVMATVGGYRSAAAVPIVRDGLSIGSIAVTRARAGLLPDRQIELLKTFADQAVIAIENVRLFRELEARNRDLTATGEILRVIASSPTDVQPVLNAVAESAAHLCEAPDVSIFLREPNALRVAARHGAIPSDTALPLSRETGVGAAVLEGQTVHVADMQTASGQFPVSFQNAQRLGFRTALNVPLMREGVAIGAISLRRTEAHPFTDQQVSLLEAFADQAVIAIENVRLFTELQASNRELTTALDKQTATSDILRVISQSQTNVQPVFDAIVGSVVRLMGAYTGMLTRIAGDQIEMAALTGTDAAGDAATRAVFPQSLQSEEPHAQVIRDRVPLNIADAHTDPRVNEAHRAVARARGNRSWVIVPLLRHEEAVGSIGVTRRDPGGFTDAEIALLQTFADQAVIAIENVRLFKELAASNREIAEKSYQLEVASQHKSEFLANMSHELRTPLNAVIGFSEVLLQRMFGELNDKQDEYLKDIYASGQHLLSLINDILDLSKIEAGRMELELTDFDFPTALDNALTLIRERAGRRGIALHLSVDERLGQMRADERKIRQIVLNLLSNAIKFTPEGGRIEVVAVPRDEFVEVSVSDTGVGIAPEDQEAVFEEFRQVGTAAKKVEGTGLGLALSRKFIELHGGRIWLQSRVDIGSTFTFTIPVRRRE